MAGHYEILVQTEDESMAHVLPEALALIPDVQVVLVQTAGEAAQYLREHEPDLVVLDLDWPHVYQLDIIRVLAQDALDTVRAGAGDAVPIVGVSSELTRSQMMDLGLVEGIRKPFDVFDLEGRVGRILAAGREQRHKA